MELCPHHHRHNFYTWCRVFPECRIPLYITRDTKQESVGRNQSDHHPIIHKWSHVQSHQEGPIRCWKWPRWHILFCWWILQSIWHGDPNCSRYVYVFPVEVGTWHVHTNLLHSDGTLSFATIALALRVPRMSDPKQQQLAVFIWGAVMFGMYSFLLSVFRIKNGGYPFHLPPF